MSIFKRTDKVKELYKKLGNHKIKVVAGIRRSGKTFLVDSLFYEYVISKKDFDLNCFQKIFLAGRDKNLRQESSFKKYLIDLANSNVKIIFIDEIQEAENYQKTLKDFHSDYPNIDLYITGSNSNTLSVDIIEDFKELGDTIILYPLTFKEIRKVKRNYKLEDYLKYGGLPIVVNSKDKEEEIDNIYKNVYQIDILERANQVCKSCLGEDDMKAIMENLFSSVTPFSVVSMTNKLCEKYGFDDNHKMLLRKEIEDFLSIVTKSFLFNNMQNESTKRKTPLDKIGLNKKYYCCDCGIAYNQCNIPIHKYTLSLETAVYLHLTKQKMSPNCLLIIGKKNNVVGEIDFNYQHRHMQVAYSLTENNYDREIGNLVNLKDDYEKVFVYVETLVESKDKDVQYIKADKYLLS